MAWPSRPRWSSAQGISATAFSRLRLLCRSLCSTIVNQNRSVLIGSIDLDWPASARAPLTESMRMLPARDKGEPGQAQPGQMGNDGMQIKRKRHGPRRSLTESARMPSTGRPGPTRVNEERQEATITLIKTKHHDQSSSI